MNILELIDPASSETMDLHRTLSLVSVFSFMFAAVILVSMIISLAHILDRQERSPRLLVTTLAVGIALIGASVGAMFASSSQINTINDDRAANSTKNTVALQEWSEDVYGINLNEKQAREMIRATGQPSYGVVPSKYEGSDELTELGGSLVRDASDEVTKAQLVYDGDGYILIRDSGGEFERR